MATPCYRPTWPENTDNGQHFLQYSYNYVTTGNKIKITNLRIYQNGNLSDGYLGSWDSSAVYLVINNQSFSDNGWFAKWCAGNPYGSARGGVNKLNTTDSDHPALYWSGIDKEIAPSTERLIENNGNPYLAYTYNVSITLDIPGAGGGWDWIRISANDTIEINVNIGLPEHIDAALGRQKACSKNPPILLNDFEKPILRKVNALSFKAQIPNDSNELYKVLCVLYRGKVTNNTLEQIKNLPIVAWKDSSSNGGKNYTNFRTITNNEKIVGIQGEFINLSPAVDYTLVAYVTTEDGLGAKGYIQAIVVESTLGIFRWGYDKNGKLDWIPGDVAPWSSSNEWIQHK